MADDTKGLEAAGTDPIAHTSEAPPEPATTAASATEWTASDTRGPLHEAPPLDHTALGDASPHGRNGLTSAGAPPGEAQSPNAAPEAPATALAPDAAKPPRRSPLPIAAAVIVGAIIGAGSAYLVYRSQTASEDGLAQTMAQLSGRMDALEKRPDDQQAIAFLKSSVATLDDKVARLQKAAGVAPAASPLAPSRPPAGSSPASAITPSASAPAAIPSAAAPHSGSSPAASIASTAPTPPPAAKPSTVASPAIASAPQVASPPAFDPAPLQQKIAALQATIDGLQKQAAASVALAATVGVIQTSVDGLKTKTADVQKQTSEVQKQTSDMQKQTLDVVKQTSEVQKQASSAQAGVEAIQGQQKSFEGRISAPALAVVADSLVQQIAEGQAYSQQVDALATLGADPARIAVLRENARKGVPSAKTLATQFKPLEEPILGTEHKAAPNASLLDRLKSGMAGLVSIRSTSDTTGDGLGARVSRIEDDLTHNDVMDAYATWAALPAGAKAKSDAWGALAKSTTEAIDAAHALQQGAIATLGGRKS